jgi:DnaJ-class molecular chaperone
MTKNYYIVLGVEPDATQEEIKSAYRRQARKLHPDHSGAGCEPFLAIQEAYEALRDPDRRKGHDDELARARRARSAHPEVRVESLRSRPCPVEPLIPRQGARRLGDAFSDRRYHPLFDDFLEQAWDDPDATGRSSAYDGQHVSVEIPLTRQQALRGGRARVWIPVEVRCPECRGRGGVGFLACLRCAGRGSVGRDVPVVIAFPSRIVDGSTASLSLSPLGLGRSTLMVAFRVQ